MNDPFTDLDINAKAQLSILEACRKNNRDIRIVFASTRQIYGKPQYLPVDEKHPLNPVDVNGINKIAGEQYHLLYNQVHEIRSSRTPVDQHLRSKNAHKRCPANFSGYLDKKPTTRKTDSGLWRWASKEEITTMWTI